MTVHIKYKTTRTALRGEITCFNKRVREATTDLYDFSKSSTSNDEISVLLTKFMAHHESLQKKVDSCNENLGKLQDDLDKVANDVEKEWSMEHLQNKLK